MAVLTKKEILTLIRTKELVFSPKLDVFQIQPHSIDLRLGPIFYIPKSWKMTKKGREAINVDPLDPLLNSDNYTQVTLKSGQFFELLPNRFVVVPTLEKIEINTGDIMGTLFPRSSVNRRGLAVNLTGLIDVWYRGTLMIPIVNNTNSQHIRIYPGERVCQITFDKLASSVDKKTAQMHGLMPAKYSGSNAKNVVRYKLEKKIEVDLVKKGHLDQLKKRYGISL